MKKIIGLGLILIFLGSSWIGGFFVAEDHKTQPAQTVLPCDVNCTNLPIILIDTKGEVIKKDSKVNVEVKVIDNEDKNSIELTPDFISDATIKYRGNSSYGTFDKFQYRVEFFDDIAKDDKRNYPLFGMARESDWVLYGPFLDRSLLRNRLMYGLSKDLLEWAPDTRFFELYVDDEYQGVYLAVEPITASENRIGLNQFGLLSGETPYIVRRDRVGTNHQVIQTYGEIKGYTSNELSIDYPGINNLTSQQYDWITQDVSRFEETLYSDYFDHPELGYEHLINMSSFVDYFILNEFAMITDLSELSTYVYKDLGGKLTFTVWDFNNGFNNYQWTDQSYERYFNLDANWFDRLIQDRKFVSSIVERYRTLRKGILSDAALMNRIDQEVLDLGDAVNRNFEVWGYTFNQNLLSKDSNGLIRDPKSYEDAINQLKDTILKRLNYMDNTIEDLYTYCIN